MLPRRKVKSNSGAGLLNTIINSVPFELHLPGYQYCGPGTNLGKRLALGQTGINGLDSACKDHDIAYEKSNSLSERSAADSILEERAWSRVGAKDSGYKEKAAAWLVTTGMKAKRKTGAGCGFGNIVGACKKAIKKSIKTCPSTPNMGKLIKSAVCVARKHVKTNRGARKNKNKLPRVIKVPKTGGALALIPILAGLSALGSLAGGVSNIVKTIRSIRSNSGSPIQLGKGMYLNPHKSAGGSYTIARKSSVRGSRKSIGGNGLKKVAVKRKKISSTKLKNKKSVSTVRRKSTKTNTARKSSRSKN